MISQPTTTRTGRARLARRASCLVLGLAAILPAQDSGEKLDELAAAWRKVHGVQLRWNSDGAGLPGGWSPKVTKARPGDPATLPWVKALRAFFPLYPRRILRQAVREIHILDTLMLSGLRHGGACYGSRIYLTVEGQGSESTMWILHHEMTHALVSAFAFPRDRWLEVTPTVDYRQEKPDESRTSRRFADFSPELFERGFVTDYSCTRLEEDACDMAAMAFMEPRKLAAAAARYPLIRAKRDLLFEWYRHLHPDLCPHRLAGPEPGPAMIVAPPLLPHERSRREVRTVDPPAVSRPEAAPAESPRSTLIVHVLDGEGRPYMDASLAAIEPWPATALLDAHRAADFLALGARNAAAGTVALPLAATGTDYVVRVADAGNRFEPELRLVQVPANPGEILETTVSLETPWPSITGRLLLPDGRPLAGHFRWVPGHPGRPRNRGVEVREDWTDGAGRFRLEVPDFHRASRFEQILVRARGPAHAGLPDFDRFSAALLLPPGLLTGGLELGDQTLPELTLIAAGRIVDDDGNPVPDARVEIADAFQRLGPAFKACQSDGDGCFRLYGEAEFSSTSLRITARGFQPKTPSVRTGATDLRLLLLRSGGIEGRVLLPPGVAASVVVVDVRDETCRSETDSRRIRPDGDGRFTCDDLKPGACEVQVLRADTGEAVESVTGLRVESGRRVRDSRLENIDLRRAVRPLVIAILDEQCRPVPGAEAVLDPLPARVHWRTTGATRTADANGRAVLGAFEIPVDVQVGAPGFRTVRLPQVDGDREVVLQPGFPVRFIFDPGDAAIEGEGMVVALLLQPAHSTDLPFLFQSMPRSLSVPYRPGAEALVRLPEPGPWSVRAECWRRRRWGSIAVYDPFLIHVSGSGATVEARIRLDPESVSDWTAGSGR